MNKLVTFKQAKKEINGIYIKELEKQISKMAAVLEFYADESSYDLRYVPREAMEMSVVKDHGFRARKILAQIRSDK